MSDSSSDDSVKETDFCREREQPSCHYFGKPNEVYCNLTFEFCSDNQFIPIENILGIVLSWTYTINDKTVLVVSPLIS